MCECGRQPATTESDRKIQSPIHATTWSPLSVSGHLVRRISKITAGCESQIRSTQCHKTWWITYRFRSNRLNVMIISDTIYYCLHSYTLAHTKKLIFFFLIPWQRRIESQGFQTSRFSSILFVLYFMMLNFCLCKYILDKNRLIIVTVHLLYL